MSEPEREYVSEDVEITTRRIETVVPPPHVRWYRHPIARWRMRRVDKTNHLTPPEPSMQIRRQIEETLIGGRRG